jgi:hypothetical protein
MHLESLLPAQGGGASRRLVTLLGTLGAVVVAAGPLADGAAARSLHLAAAKPASQGRLGPAARQLRRQGFLVPDQAGYERAKARAARRAPLSPAAGAELFAPLVPTTSTSFAGVRDSSVGPPDTTGAVGNTRFIETVNNKFAIYNKTSTTALSTGSLNSLWGTGSVFTTDPQVIWDPGTKRFYYAGLILVSATDNRLTFGFSKTGSPNSAADFCKYTISFGTELPDFPKLGDTSDFGLIGANTFSNSTPAGTFVGSDIVAVTKPPAGSTCPAASSLGVNGVFGIQNADSTAAFTPVPANQIDSSGTGWVVSNADPPPSTKLSLFKVTRNANGTANIQSTGTNLTVPSFSTPPNAPQSGTSRLLSTADTRLTQAVSAIDPARGTSGKVALWTQHTVAGGAGAEVRWHEIDPAAHTLFQSGTATSASLYSFNGGISPNRAVNGATKKFGRDMAMSFNTSSSTTHPSIKVVSKLGAAAQSAPVVVRSSPASLNDFTCTSGSCRWGDYAGATPDPVPPSGSSLVWMVNERVVTPGSASASGWGSWNFAVKP